MAMRIQRTCQQCGVMFEVRPRSGNYPQKYCSVPCANLGTRKARPKTRYAKSKVPEGHPLRDPHGQCMTHRLVLWDRIGPGDHPCHYCSTTVAWKPGERLTATSLIAEHMDGNTRNNDPANIVAACQKCNASKMERSSRPAIRPGEVTFAYANGQRTRGVVRHCLSCGEEFTVRVNAGPREGQYCSRRCVNFRGARQCKVCAHCGVGFLTYQDSVCCSRACSYAARRKAATKPCAYCGIDFYSIGGKRSYCGLACSRAANRGRPRRRAGP